MDIKTIAIGIVVGLLLGVVAGYGMSSSSTSSLQSQINGLKTEADKVPSLTQQITTLTNEKTTIQSQVSSLQTQVSTLTSEKTNLQSQVDSKNTQVTSLNNQINSLNAQITDLKSQTPQEVQVNVKSDIPANFQLISNNTFIDSLDSYEFVGELKYTGVSNVRFVKICGAFYDSTGKLIDTAYTYSALSILKNGDLSPFKLRSDGGNRVATYTLSISSDVTTDTPYRSFTVSGESTSTDIFGTKLSASATNSGSSTSEFTEFVVTFYDSNMKILDYDTGFLTPSTIASGATGMFEARLSSAFNASFYSIVIES
jgi:regulator of replication initiation timing